MELQELWNYYKTSRTK